MPELPEVEAPRRAVEDNCVGKRITKCVVADDSKVIHVVPRSNFEASILGKLIVAAHRKGKNMWLQLDSPLFPSFQFGMTGAIYIKGVAVTNYKRSAVKDEDEWPSKYSKFFIENGPDECELNSLESCALNLWHKVDIHYYLINCFEYLVIGGKSMEWVNCLSQLGLPKEPIMKCFNMGNGTQLGKTYINQTAQLYLPPSFLPWVVVNNQPVGKDYENFAHYVCKAYKGVAVPEFAENEDLQAEWLSAKMASKRRLAQYVLQVTGESIDPDSLFDIQVKRIHEYKR